MIVFNKNARPYIEAHLQEFSPVERKIADYFLGGGETPPEETGKALAKRLGVSEAALTRFSQKCGFRGLRELFYAHNQTENQAVATSSNPSSPATKNCSTKPTPSSTCGKSAASPRCSCTTH